ncbi:MAG: hypothetical protein U9Q88_12690 [Bacillota bacterium]|uniref:hypothetical protein n=1 Tax=Bacillus sp. RO2 TaxID=2723913 RepID=UPI00145E3A88|nr:hypothetical protein [Bacillus sp. RO2]MEA3320857.1 hypothetical protein [Bacillota bacterium]NMH71752.1 hypothetical protein [Bacillus sp. RO2]
MKYAQTLLVAILLISGTFIWYSFYTTFQEKRDEVAQPSISSPTQEETGAPLSVDQDRDEKVIIPHIYQNGLTHQMVNEWNIEDERISIDRLLSLLEKNKP